MNKKDNLGFNILKLNPSRLIDPDESLFILAGEYQDRTMTLYEGHLTISMTDATERLVFVEGSPGGNFFVGHR